MTLKLVVTTNVNGDVFELVLKNARYGVGRRHDNDLRIKETYISGYHAELVRGENGDYLVSDLGSSNGTFLNGRRLSGSEAIKAGDFIKFGILKVAVQEHTDTMPKIVSLRDRPAFARKEGSNTAAIAVERKTGSVATVEGASHSGETRATPTERPAGIPVMATLVSATATMAESRDLKGELEIEKKEIARLNRQIADGETKFAKLEGELEGLKRQLAEREQSLHEAAAKSEAGSGFEKELKAREAELAKVKAEAEKLSAEAATNASFEKELKAREAELAKAKAEAEKLSAEAAAKASLEKELKAREAELAKVKAEAEKLSEEAAAKALLEKELKAREGELAKAKSEAEKLSEEAATKASLEKELKAREGELAKAKSEADAKAVEIARLEAEAGKAKGEIEKTSLQAGQFERELAELRTSITRAERETQEARTALADREKALLERESTLATVSKERESLLKTVEAKESDLAATAGELAKIALLSASLAGLERELAEARLHGESVRAERDRLESDLKARESDLSQHRQGLVTMEAQVASLTASAETEKSGLARELGEAKATAAEMAADLKSVRAELDSERKALGASSKELEREKTKLEKALVALEAKHTKQSEEQVALKSALQDKEKELKSLSDEAKKVGQVSQEMESVKAELAEANEALAAARAQESKLLADSGEREARLSDLETALAAAESGAKDLSAQVEEGEAAIALARSEASRVSDEFEAFRRESGEQSGIALAAAAALTVAKEKELAELRARLEKETAAAAEVAEGLAEERARRTAIEQERTSLAAELEQLRKAGDGTSGELVALRSQWETLVAERDELRSRESLQTNDLQAAKAEANELRIEMRKGKEAAESAHRELETTLRSRVAELETALAAERVRATDTGSEKTRVEESLAILRTEMEALKEESAQLRVRNEEASRNNGRLQAELHRETTERSQVNEALETSRVRVNGLVTELEVLKNALEGKEREMAEREQQFTRSESETVQKIKRDLSEAIATRDVAEEKAAKAQKEKQSLSGAFERLKEQLDQTEAALRAAKEVEEEMNHGKGLLARRLEKAESSNNELAARIKEEAMAALASRTLIEKLELQIRENESEAVAREREQVNALQADLSRASRRAAEDERRRRELEAELTKVTEARRQAEERILSLEARIVEQESEAESTRGLLNETEKSRIDLVSRLAAETSLVETHTRTIEGLRRELAETISRFTSSESAMIARHGEETDALLADFRSEKTRREGLEVELRNTREGLSDAVRQARENSEKAQAKLLAAGSAKLSAVEEELSKAIRARELIEQSRSALEDELNDREEEIESLSERIEDLEIRLRDETESRHGVLRLLDTTRAGFSDTLRSGWEHLGAVRNTLGLERGARQEAEDALVRAREEIDRLGADLKEWERHHQAEIREWEDRYETLRGEKLTLASEDADLRKIRDEIMTATAKKRSLEDEIEKLGSGVKDIQARQGELKSQRESLLAEREELKAALNAARMELGILQKRCTDSKEQEEKHGNAIATAERRIQSLRKLESEMEHAVERRRQQHQLSRGEVFSEPDDLGMLAASADFSQEDFYRKLIGKLDLIDDLAKRYDNKWLYPKVSEQLGILKRSFVEFLQDHSVQPFDLEPGTVVSISERKRIKLVPLQNGAPKKANGNGSQSSLVVETVRPGYVYRNGSKDVIIRKAEVVVS
jgi:chromosome segregation ATPase